ncbi:MAG: tetratricopeptide repeat protein [Planctomycetales bacterium]|nr:tetratricopeptide repeat protein [Planctomycetales bacterium]
MSNAPEPSPWIVDTTDADFLQDTIERSRDVPVVVDFWAAWCQPCRMLGPVLEKLAREFDGQFVLVKADGDHCPVAASQFNIQAYPTVFGLRGGEAVDYFEGVLPEPQLREWLTRLLPGEVEQLIAQAKQVRQSDPAQSESLLRDAVEKSTTDIAAQVELARLLFDLDRLDEAHDLLTTLHEMGYDAGDVPRLLSAVDVKRAGEQAGGVDACRAACAAAPSDMALKLQLAAALSAAAQYEEALQTALAVLQTDKPNHGEAARQIMVGVFNLLPDDSELTHDYRRKLSAALY